MLVIVGFDMSISRVEEELVRIKEDFSQIPAVKTAKPEAVQKKKRSHPFIVLVAVVIIVLAVLALVYIFFGS
jgi:hypothetical protein